MPETFEEIGANVDYALERVGTIARRTVRRLLVCRGETAHSWGPEMRQERDPYTSGRDYNTIVQLRQDWYATHPPQPTGAEVCARCGARRSP